MKSGSLVPRLWSLGMNPKKQKKGECKYVVAFPGHSKLWSLRFEARKRIVQEM